MDNQKLVALGLCEESGEIPDGIEEYVFPECLEVDFSVEGMKNLNVMACRRMGEYVGCRIWLYVTGLSPALAAVMMACRALAIPLILWHYNRDTGEYVPQEV